MLVRQPPPAMIEIAEHVRSLETGRIVVKQSAMFFDEKKPLTMGLLYDLIESFVAVYGGTYNIRWPCIGLTSEKIGRKLHAQEIGDAERDCVLLLLIAGKGSTMPMEGPPENHFPELRLRSGGFVEPCVDFEGGWKPSTRRNELGFTYEL